MVSTVRSRPNHYEMLGLSPDASDEEISRAFSREMRMFRPLADVARIGVAFETLRDPAKRRDYDESMGLRREPPPPPPPPAAISFRTSGHMVGSTAQPEPKVRQEPTLEQRLGSFIASSVRDASKPVVSSPPPPPPPQPERRPPPVEAARPVVSRPAVQPPMVAPAREDDLGEAEDGRIGLNRTAGAIGALVLAVGLVGAWAGLEAGHSAEAQGNTVSMTLPQPKPARIAAAAAPEVEAPDAFQARAGREARIAVAAAPHLRRARPIRQASISEASDTGQDQSPANAYYDSPPVETAAVQPVTDAPAAETVSAAMPLPDKVIARTIDRIGYSCGKVASSSAVEGAPGTYNVTCTSGQTYQATPVHGRYRFRRSH